MENPKKQQIESDLLDAIDLAWESFERLCADLNLLYAYQFATEYRQELIYPSLSFSAIFRHLSNSVSADLNALKSALTSIGDNNKSLSLTL